MHSGTDAVLCLTLVRSPLGRTRARMMIESLRRFGGGLSCSPVWLYEADPDRASCQELQGNGVQILPLDAPAAVRNYLFGDKVWACAQAEALTNRQVRSLVWIDPGCLIVQPPLLFDLGKAYDAAVRPVHIQNVGLVVDQPLDAFWRGIYAAVGVTDVQASVESFVDGRRLRAYFNSHAFAMNPATGLMGRWLEIFTFLVNDKEFQATACQDEGHQVFLFQAIWSALLATILRPDHIRLLPPEYNYPYHLHERLLAGRRAKALNDLVVVANEDRPLDPESMSDIEVREPLRSWLSAAYSVQ